MYDSPVSCDCACVSRRGNGTAWWPPGTATGVECQRRKCSCCCRWWVRGTFYVSCDLTLLRFCPSCVQRRWNVVENHARRVSVLLLAWQRGRQLKLTALDWTWCPHWSSHRGLCGWTAVSVAHAETRKVGACWRTCLSSERCSGHRTCSRSLPSHVQRPARTTSEFSREVSKTVLLNVGAQRRREFL